MRSRWLGCLLVVAVAACGDSGDDTGVGTGTIVSGTGGLTGGVGSVPTPGGGTIGSVVPGVAGGIGGGGTTGGAVRPPVIGGGEGGVAGGTATGTVLPCEVQKILKDKCQACHSNPPVGAPYPLVTLADLQGKSGSKPTLTVAQRIKEKINDTTAPMPPVTSKNQLTAAEKATLTSFIDGGAKGVAAAAAAACAAPATTGGGGGGTMGGTVPPVSSANCDYEMKLLAHGGQGENDTTPYNATGQGDAYEIFWYKPTWNEKVQAIAIDPVIDNGSVLHHWLLYMKQNGSETPGSHNSDSGLQSGDSQLASGWAPGNDGWKQPADIGMQVVYGPQARFGIEIHYNTTANPPKRADRSGARLCLTKTLRAKEAGTHWLGTQAIIGTSAEGTCTVPTTSHIVAMSPHMHKTGKYMKTIIAKKNGQKVTITDQPFAFTDQQIFPVPGGEIVVDPGDVITTTCDYTTFATFGPGTSDEMCYNFIVAWPSGSLSAGAGIVGGKNTCIDFI